MKATRCKNCGHALKYRIHGKYTHRERFPWSDVCSVQRGKNITCMCDKPEKETKKK